MMQIYVLSDSLGNTATDVVRAALAQFDLVDSDYKIHKVPRVSHFTQIDEIFHVITPQDMIVQTIVSQELSHYTKEQAKLNHVVVIDILSDLLQTLENKLNTTIQNRPGEIRKLGENYFRRIDALEFAVRYDDGKDINGLREADIVILGVSRTSKTPLSMYLANKNLKVMNIPLVPEMNLPKQLFEIDSRKLIGLTTSIEHLNSVRKERLKALGVSMDNSYSTEKRILEELEYADNLMRRLKCPVIHVENKAIEETAEIVLNIMKERGVNMIHI